MTANKGLFADITLKVQLNALVVVSYAGIVGLSKGWASRAICCAVVVYDMYFKTL